MLCVKLELLFEKLSIKELHYTCDGPGKSWLLLFALDCLAQFGEKFLCKLFFISEIILFCCLKPTLCERFREI